jgi:hypothetical protein
MRKNELSHILETYLNKEKKVKIFYDIDEIELNKLLRNMQPFDKPDIISTYDNKVVGIEHFEFDSYNNTEKGSDYRLKTKHIQEQLQEIGTIDIINLESTSSLENYYKNFIKIFKDHYEKIGVYEDRVKMFYNTDSEVELWYFIEDVTLFGNFFRSGEDKVKRLLPIYFKEVIDTLRKSPKIKGIFLGTNIGREHQIVIIKNDEETLKRLEFECLNLTEEDFITFEPKIKH